jgi:hypothetical protein
VNAGRALVGAALVAFGGVLLADGAGLIDAAESVREGWPLVFVFLGAAQVAVDRRLSMVSGLLIAGGGVALAVTTGAVDADLWSLVWPIMLIGAGVWLVAWRRIPVPTRADEISRLAVFAPARIASRAGALRRAEVTSVFTSLSLDLSRARLDPGGGRVAATAVFGQIVVVVPKGWRIAVRGLPIFGGWDDTTSRVETAPDSPLLRVQVLSLFGGVEVRHPRVWR